MAPVRPQQPAPRVAVCIHGLGGYWSELERGAFERLRQEPAVDCSWLAQVGVGHDFRWLAGLILRAGDPVLVQALRAQRVRAINVSGYLRCALPRAGVDERAVGRLAAQTLAELGRRDFVYVGDESYSSELRRRGLLQGARERVCALQCVVSLALFSDPRELREWSQGRPLGVLAANDDVAVAIVQRCLAAGLAVPEQVAILGVGNSERAQLHSPRPLSSFELPAYGIGWAAAEMLLEWLAQPRVRPADRLLPPLRVVHRSTTGANAVADPVVSATLQLIAKTGGTGLTVEGVVGKVKAGTRRTLERRFRRTTGQGIHAALRGARLARAKELLLQPGVSIKEVAFRAGFSSPQKFANVFHAVEGCAPREFRERAGVA